MAGVTKDQVEAFCRVDFDFGDGGGFANGYGCVGGSGDGSGYGGGYDDGSGSGGGYGTGSGDGSGYGTGSGDGSGYGTGFGTGEGISSVSGLPVFTVDYIQTAIEHIHGNVARVYILENDLTLSPGYLIRQENLFAHGETLRKAQEALFEKLFDEMSEDERIDAFVESYPKTDNVAKNADLFDWHHRLTGSCEQGRKSFARDHGVSLEGKMTVSDFIKLTKNSYGSQIIQDLEKRYSERME